VWSLQEPNNLKGRNSFRYSGLVQRRTVGVEPASDGKAVILVTRNTNCMHDLLSEKESWHLQLHRMIIIGIMMWLWSIFTLRRNDSAMYMLSSCVEFEWSTKKRIGTRFYDNNFGRLRTRFDLPGGRAQTPAYFSITPLVRAVTCKRRYVH